MKKLVLLLCICFIANGSLSQQYGQFQGTYTGKFYDGGFEDSLIFTGRFLIVVKNKAHGYGVEHRYTYAISSVNDSTVLFTETGHLRDGKDAIKNGTTGDLNGKEVKMNLLESGNLQFTFVSDYRERREFMAVLEQ